MRRIGFGIMIVLLLAGLGFSQVQLTPNWQIPVDTKTWFKNDNTTRGLAYNPKTDHVLVVSRTGAPRVVILNAATGDSIGVLNLTNVAGGTFPINLIDVDENGVIYACNLSTSATSNFKVYRWDNEAAAPTVAFDGVFPTSPHRYGDAFAVVGTATATEIYAAGGGNCLFIGLLTTGDGLTFAINDTIRVGTRARLGVDVTETGNIWGNAAFTKPALFGPTGALLGEVAQQVAGFQNYNIKYFKSKFFKTNPEFIAVNENTADLTPKRSRLINVTNGPLRAFAVGETPLIGTKVNLNGTGTFGYDTARNALIVLLTNNMIGSYKLAEAEDRVGVTFQVDMSIQKQLKTFNPDSHIVVIRGSFIDEANPALQEWKGNRFECFPDPASPDVYTLTVGLPALSAGSEFKFKYVIERLAARGDSTTQGGTWESIPDRSFTLQKDGQVLDKVFFNDRSVIGVTATVTFQADMSELIAKGWFDPASDSIKVVGGFNDWSVDKAPKMVPDLFNPSLYLSDIVITAAPNTDYEWKFRAMPFDKFADNGWEGGSNHKFTFTGQNLTLPALKPNIGFAGKPLAIDVKVRFTVDMRNATETYNNRLLDNIIGVWIKGDKTPIGAWGGNWTYGDTISIMKRCYDDGVNGADQVKGDGIWSAEVLFPAGTRSGVFYKYGAGAAGVDTLNKGVSYLDNEAQFAVNHFVILSDAQPIFNVPLDRFGSLRILKNATVFTVNMSVQKLKGTFDPAKNIVVMRGSFENESIPNAEEWKGNMFRLWPIEGQPDLYRASIQMPDNSVGQEFAYKFVITDNNLTTILDRTTQGGIWESRPDRKFTTKAGGDTLAVVYFDDETGVPVTATVTFQADMSDLITKGWFDPASDSIKIVGGFNDWSVEKSKPMVPDLFNPNLYLSDIPITAVAGKEYEWKFRAMPFDKFADNGWESGSNHKFTFTGSPLTLPPLKPAIGFAGKEISRDVTVRFQVDVKDAINWYTKVKFPSVTGVYIKGDKPQLGAWGGSWTRGDIPTTLIPLYDDGSHGDQTANDQIWTVEILFPQGTRSGVLYKFGIDYPGAEKDNNGVAYLDNEAGFGNNHFFNINDTQPLQILFDKFGSQNVGVAERLLDARIPKEYVLDQNYPNPFNPTTTIEYGLPKNSFVQLSVYNMLGQQVVTLVEEKQAAGFYRVAWDTGKALGNNVPSGIYFYILKAEGVKITKKMLLVR